MKIDRLMGILAILLRKEKVTAPYLAEKFEVSRRTINRDIEALCMAGIPVITTQGAGGGISIDENYKLDKTLLKPEETHMILAGLKGLDSVSSGSQYSVLMEKVKGGESQEDLSGGSILIDLASFYKGSLTPKIEALRRAIRENRTVSFDYYLKGISQNAIRARFI